MTPVGLEVHTLQSGIRVLQSRTGLGGSLCLYEGHRDEDPPGALWPEQPAEAVPVPDFFTPGSALRLRLPEPQFLHPQCLSGLPYSVTLRREDLRNCPVNPHVSITTNVPNSYPSPMSIILMSQTSGVGDKEYWVT